MHTPESTGGHSAEGDGPLGHEPRHQSPEMAASQSERREGHMSSIVYLVGAVVIVVFVLKMLGVY